MSETDLSRSIRAALTVAGYWVERTNSGIAKVRGGFVHMCSAGTPDTLVVAPVYGWLETKTQVGKLSEEQLSWHERARAAGVRVATVRSVSQAIDAVKGWRK
jgi:hypothetical protein